MTLATRAPATRPGAAFVRPRRIAAYLRVSTQEQMLGYGIEAQLEAIMRAINNNPENVLIRVFRDEGISGTVVDRDGMLELEESAKRGEFDAIMVQRVDRIGRKFSSFYYWVRTLKEELEVDFIAVEQGIDTATSMGMNWLIQLGQMAAMEHELIVARTQDGKQLKARAGGWPSGRPPYGIALEGKGQRGSIPVLNPEEVTVYAKIAELLVDDKKTVAETAKALNALGLTSRTGSPWTPELVYARVFSEALDGTHTFRKTEAHVKAGGRAGHKTRTVLTRNGDPKFGETVVIQLPQIMKPERVAAMRARITRKPQRRDTDNIYPLSTHMLSPCGLNYTGSPDRNGNRRYACRAHSASITCGCPTLMASEVEDVVWGRLTEFFRDKAQIQRKAESLRREIPSDHDRLIKRATALRTELTERAARKEQAVYNLAVASISAEDAAPTLERLRTEWEATRDLLEETETQLEQQAGKIEQINEYLVLLETMTFDLAKLSLEDQARFIDMCDLQIEVAATPEGYTRTGNPSDIMKWHFSTKTPIPGEITDEQWDRMLCALKEVPGLFGSWTKADVLKGVINGALWRLRTGKPYKEMPASYGSAKNVHARTQQLWEKGVWPTLMELMEAESSGTPMPFTIGLPDLVIRGKVTGEVLSVLGSGSTLDPEEKRETRMSDQGLFTKSSRSDIQLSFELVTG